MVYSSIIGYLQDIKCELYLNLIKYLLNRDRGRVPVSHTARIYTCTYRPRSYWIGIWTFIYSTCEHLHSCYIGYDGCEWRNEPAGTTFVESFVYPAHGGGTDHVIQATVSMPKYHCMLLCIWICAFISVICDGKYKLNSWINDLTLWDGIVIMNGYVSYDDEFEMSSWILV